MFLKTLFRGADHSTPFNPRPKPRQCFLPPFHCVKQRHHNPTLRSDKASRLAHSRRPAERVQSNLGWAAAVDTRDPSRPSSVLAAAVFKEFKWADHHQLWRHLSMMIPLKNNKQHNSAQVSDCFQGSWKIRRWLSTSQKKTSEEMAPLVSFELEFPYDTIMLPGFGRPVKISHEGGSNPAPPRKKLRL